MPTKNRKNKESELLIQTVVAAALGMGLTLLFTALCAAGIAAGWIQGGAERTCLFLAILFGSCVSGCYLKRRVKMGIFPLLIITVAAYMALLILLTALKEKGEILGPQLLLYGCVTLIGSTIGMVTNFSKSNKSYINKTKRKRRITISNHSK